MTHTQPHMVTNTPSHTHSNGLVCLLVKPQSLNLWTTVNIFNTSSFHNSLRKPILLPRPGSIFQRPLGPPCPCMASPKDREPGAGTGEAGKIIWMQNSFKGSEAWWEGKGFGKMWVREAMPVRVQNGERPQCLGVSCQGKTAPNKIKCHGRLYSRLQQ